MISAKKEATVEAKLDDAVGAAIDRLVAQTTLFYRHATELGLTGETGSAASRSCRDAERRVPGEWMVTPPREAGRVRGW
jgi:hypothetical protein